MMTYFCQVGTVWQVLLLVFSLLYPPCVAAMAAVKREMGGKWAWGVGLWQLGIAWVAALVVRTIGLAIGMM